MNIPSRFSRRGVSVAALLALLSPAAALRAQTAAPAAKPAATAESVVTLSPFEVSVAQDDGYRSTNAVTGAKTNTPIRETPQSIQIINRSFLDDQQVLAMADALRYTSSIIEDNSPRGDRFGVRGFVTGIPFKNGFRDTGRAPRDTANFDRIEVAKGPASVTLSRTSPGGALNVLTKLPQRRAAQEITFSAGSDAFYRATFDVTGPLGQSQQLFYRLNAAWQNSESFRDTFFIRRSFFSPALTWQPNERTRVHLEVEYFHDIRRTDNGLAAVGDHVVAVPRGTYYGEPYDRNTVDQITARYEVLHTLRPWLSVRQATRFNQAREWGYETLFRNPTNLTATSVELLRQVEHTHDNFVSNTYTQNEILFDFTTGPMRHKTIVGFEYGFNLDGGIRDRATLANINLYNPVRGVAVPGVFTPNANNAAMTWFRESYAQDQVYLFHGRLTLLAGVRHANYGQRSNNYRTGAVTRGGGSDPNPRYGAVWLPTDTLSIFAARTYLQVPSTGANPDGFIFEPVQSQLTELGARAELFERRLAVGASYYDLVQSNVLVPDPVLAGFRIQTGERTAQGFELDLTARPAPGWQVLGAAAFTDAKISRDTSIPVGNKLANTPDRSYSLWNKYNLRQGALKGLGLGAGVIYVGARKGDTNNTFSIDAYTRVDLSLDYRWGRWGFALNVRNALDEKYIRSASSRTSIFPGEPRALLSRVRYRF